MGTIKIIYGPDGQAYIVDIPDDMTADETGVRTSEQSGEHYPDAKVASLPWQANTRQLPASFSDNYPVEDDMSGWQFAPGLTDVSRGNSWQASPSLPVRRVWQDDACVRDDEQMPTDRFSPFLNMNSHVVAPLALTDITGIKTKNFTSKVSVSKITQMGTYHRQGLAREFNLVGQLPLTIKWKAGDESNLQVKIRK